MLYVPHLYDKYCTPKYRPHPWLPKQLRLPGTKTSSRYSLGPLRKHTGSSTSCTMVGFGWTHQLLEELCPTAGPCVWLGNIYYMLWCPNAAYLFLLMPPIRSLMDIDIAEEGFMALASICATLKYRLFRLRPKLHLLAHVVTLDEINCTI